MALEPRERATLTSMLLDAGVPRVEAVSFVHPGRVPQMAGAELVVAGLEPAQLARCRAEALDYDLELRPALEVTAMRELQDAGVEPDIWKLEGLDRREACVLAVETAQRGGRGDKAAAIERANSRGVPCGARRAYAEASSPKRANARSRSTTSA